jgi:hypothetical protein
MIDAQNTEARPDLNSIELLFQGVNN